MATGTTTNLTVARMSLGKMKYAATAVPSVTKGLLTKKSITWLVSIFARDRSMISWLSAAPATSVTLTAAPESARKSSNCLYSAVACGICCKAAGHVGTGVCDCCDRRAEDVSFMDPKDARWSSDSSGACGRTGCTFFSEGR